MLSQAVIRTINGLVDEHQQNFYAVSILSLAGSIGLPAWLVELRHEATHGKLPNLFVLKTSVEALLSWLRVNYWQAQSEYLISLSSKCMVTDVIDQGAVHVSCNSPDNLNRSQGPSMTTTKTAPALNLFRKHWLSTLPSPTFIVDIFIPMFLMQTVDIPNENNRIEVGDCEAYYQRQCERWKPSLHHLLKRGRYFWQLFTALFDVYLVTVEEELGSGPQNANKNILDEKADNRFEKRRGVVNRRFYLTVKWLEYITGTQTAVSGSRDTPGSQHTEGCTSTSKVDCSNGSAASPSTCIRSEDLDRAQSESSSKCEWSDFGGLLLSFLPRLFAFSATQRAWVLSPPDAPLLAAFFARHLCPYIDTHVEEEKVRSGGRKRAREGWRGGDWEREKAVFSLPVRPDVGRGGDDVEGEQLALDVDVTEEGERDMRNILEVSGPSGDHDAVRRKGQTKRRRRRERRALLRSTRAVEEALEQGPSSSLVDASFGVKEEQKGVMQAGERFEWERCHGDEEAVVSSQVEREGVSDTGGTREDDTACTVGEAMGIEKRVLFPWWPLGCIPGRLKPPPLYLIQEII